VRPLIPQVEATPLLDAHRIDERKTSWRRSPAMPIQNTTFSMIDIDKATCRQVFDPLSRN
jgi:hypothetical protein